MRGEGKKCYDSFPLNARASTACVSRSHRLPAAATSRSMASARSNSKPTRRTISCCSARGGRVGRGLPFLPDQIPPHAEFFRGLGLIR